MKTPDIPKNEEERLQTLNELNILDTSSEVELDDITKLASSICNTPVALISLVDKDRQWFKSKVGLDANETPRDVSFCGHAINKDSLFEVNNSLLDDRFKDNPLVIGEPRVIFYAGQPLVLDNGQCIGTICVIDNKPKELTKNQKDVLKILARHVVSYLQLKKSNEVLKIQQEQIIQADKMSSLGIFAAGIAHEINNPLSVVTLCANKIKHIANDENIKLSSDKILETVQRISKIINGLKVFSKKSDSIEKEHIYISKIVDHIKFLTTQLYKKSNISFSFELQEDIEIYCNPVQIEQVLINLINNASFAIKKQTNPWIKISTRKNKDYVFIAVTDSGVIKDKNTLLKCFDPFYSEKAVGEGLGLGLSISKGIAGLHGGDLTLNTKSENTQFLLKLKL